MFCGLKVERRDVTRATPVVLITVLSSLAAGCGMPTDEHVRRAFIRENPTVTVTDVASGEGDGGTVYKHIRYRLPGKTQECEVVWGYQEAEPEWRVFDKSESGLVGTLCEGCTRRPCS